MHYKYLRPHSYILGLVIGMAAGSLGAEAWNARSGVIALMACGLAGVSLTLIIYSNRGNAS